MQETGADGYANPPYRNQAPWTFVPHHGVRLVSSTARREVNRRNALRSTGPKTEPGKEVSKFNAVRHGLRSLQAVVPGESADEWEAHRDAVVADLAPLGAVEDALAEQVAAKLWRLGRVVRHEVDLIANAQDRDEVLRAHEAATPQRFNLTRADIPRREDVEKARTALEKAEKAVAARETALRVLGGLEGREDSELIPREDWGVYDALLEGLELEEEKDSPFEGDEDFVVGHLRALLRKRGPVQETADLMAAHWRDEDLPKLRTKAETARRAYRGLLRRYRAALERRRRAHGLPDAAALEKVSRYEAHLERGLHKALERLQSLQEARGAVRPRPSVAVALLQAVAADRSDQTAELASFGSSAPSALEAAGAQDG